MSTRSTEPSDVDTLRERLASLEQELVQLRHALHGALHARAPLPRGAFQVLRLEAGGQAYALPLACVTEVVRVARLVRQGREHGALLGTLNYRGAAVPVLDLGEHILHVATEWRSTTPIVITESSGSQVGFVVDAVVGVDEIPPEDARRVTAPEHGDATVWFVIELGSRLVQILDPLAIHAVARIGETSERPSTDEGVGDESAS